MHHSTLAPLWQLSAVASASSPPVPGLLTVVLVDPEPRADSYPLLLNVVRLYRVKAYAMPALTTAARSSSAVPLLAPG